MNGASHNESPARAFVHYPHTHTQTSFNHKYTHLLNAFSIYIYLHGIHNAHTHRLDRAPKSKFLILAILIAMALNSYITNAVPRHFGVIVFYAATFVLNVAFVAALVKVTVWTTLSASAATAATAARKNTKSD